MLEKVQAKADEEKSLEYLCLVGLWRSTLEDKDRDILDALLDDHSISAAWIKDQMDEFKRIGITTWKNHRKGRCACSKA